MINAQLDSATRGKMLCSRLAIIDQIPGRFSLVQMREFCKVVVKRNGANLPPSNTQGHIFAIILTSFQPSLSPLPTEYISMQENFVS